MTTLEYLNIFDYLNKFMNIFTNNIYIHIHGLYGFQTSYNFLIMVISVSQVPEFYFISGQVRVRTPR